MLPWQSDDSSGCGGLDELLAPPCQTIGVVFHTARTLDNTTDAFILPVGLCLLLSFLLMLKLLALSGFYTHLCTLHQPRLSSLCIDHELSTLHPPSPASTPGCQLNIPVPQRPKLAFAMVSILAKVYNVIFRRRSTEAATESEKDASAAEFDGIRRHSPLSRKRRSLTAAS